MLSYSCKGGMVMNNIKVRLTSIEINDLKNVKHGYINLINQRKNYSSSIIGLYGQNGSGKTTLIDALALLKLALTGERIPKKYIEYINVDSSFASLIFNFDIVVSKEETTKYNVEYSFKICKSSDETIPNKEEDTQYRLAVFDECLSTSIKSNSKKKKITKLIDTNTEKVFLPISKFKTLVGDDKEGQLNLLVFKKLASMTSRSFIFSKELVDTIHCNCQDNELLDMYNALINYGNYQLFVIDTRNSGLISIGNLPLSFYYEKGNKSFVGNILLKLNEPSSIPEEAMNTVENVIISINTVLKEVVPNLEINIKKLSTQIRENGLTFCNIQLMSLKNGKAIPLQYESEGIKKIISVLHLLIVVYNNPSITVAIDELDSGVFEYLLGELLRIISENGKGQLIFTSHNLRPLETLDKGFVCFTTTNPDNRYIRLINVKTNNNLRDFYYRDIILGEQNEPIYETTNNYNIALAFKEAATDHGS